MPLKKVQNKILCGFKLFIAHKCNPIFARKVYNKYTEYYHYEL